MCPHPKAVLHSKTKIKHAPVGVVLQKKEEKIIKKKKKKEKKYG
jgi:hypothetical protein